MLCVPAMKLPPLSHVSRLPLAGFCIAVLHTAPVFAQESTAGNFKILAAPVGVSGQSATAGNFTLQPASIGDAFSGLSTAGNFTLRAGAAGPFYSDRFNDYPLWALAELGSRGASRTADPDGDGQSNEFEFLSLTDPESASSRLELGISLLSATNIRLTLTPYFPAERKYTLLADTDLSGTAGVFDTDLGSATGNPPRSQQDFPITPATTPRRFFKAQLEIKP